MAGALGGRSGLVGHGLRERQVLGPLTVAGSPEQLVVRLRRYLCRGCGAVAVSAPRGLLRGVLYGALAIGMALALWVGGSASAAVRARISPWRSNGSERFHGWRALRRWSAQAERWWRGLVLDRKPPRERAEQIVAQLAARAPSARGDLVVLVAEGACR